MSERMSGNPHLAEGAARGLPIVAAPPVDDASAARPEPHPADAGRVASASTGWSPTAWRAGRSR